MNWDAVGAIGEIVGSLAVVISLLYLAAQAKQANRQSSSEGGFAFISELSRVHDFIFTDPEGAEIIVKLKANAELSPVEEVKAEAFADRAINAWYSAEISYKSGILEREIYRDVVDDVRRNLANYPGMRRYLIAILTHFEFAKTMGVFQPIFEESE